MLASLDNLKFDSPDAVSHGIIHLFLDAVEAHEAASLKVSKMICAVANRPPAPAESEQIDAASDRCTYLLGGISALARALYLAGACSIETANDITEYCHEHGLT